MRKLKRVLKYWPMLVGLLIISLFVFAAVAAPLLAPPSGPARPGIASGSGRPSDPTPRPPSPEAPWGTGARQVDIYYAIVWGARSALRFGLITAGLTALLGVIIGTVSGYAGGWVNSALMRFTDAFLTFPVIAGIWLFYQTFPKVGNDIELSPIQEAVIRLRISPVMVGLILFSWMAYARLVNVNVIQLKQSDFVLAARSVGANGLRIQVRHLLPNALSPAIVLLARDIGGLVLLEAAFTFIGLGGATEWGRLLVENRDWVLGLSGNPLVYWWSYVPACLALIAFGLGWNLVGDGLADLLNPRLAQR